MTPGIIRDPDTALNIRVLSPRNAQNVRLVLNEMDTWRYRRDTMVEWSDAANDPIATFTGSIENRRFRIDELQQSEAPANAPVLKVRFHGDDTVHELPVPDSDLAEEGGEIEVGVEVNGQVTVRRRVRFLEHETRQPVFVRNYGSSGAQQRPVITFVVGRDNYHQAARRFWRRRADGVIRRSNVESILDYLTNQENLQRHGEGKWGDVNIVSHANARQWMIRLFANRRFRPRHVDVNVLEEHGEDARLQAPGDGQADNQTRIILRGCVIGQNQRLLNRIQTLFGGNAHVYAPKYIQSYQWFRRGRNRWARENFEEFFFFYVPGHRSPRLNECVRRMREKYPDAGIDDDEWRELLRGRGERTRKDKTEIFRFTLDFGGDAPPTGRDNLTRVLTQEWPNDDTVYDTAVADWRWRFRRQVRGRRGNRTYRVVCIGRRRRVEVRRPLRDADGNMVVPNINEQSHYGRSPAWGWE
jgi:hypothetical protein